MMYDEHECVDCEVNSSLICDCCFNSICFRCLMLYHYACPYCTQLYLPKSKL